MKNSTHQKPASNWIALLLIISVLFGGYYIWSQGYWNAWLGESQTAQSTPADEPALQSLAAMYSPTGERSAWEAQVCEGMSENGCQIFKVMFAEALWKSAFQGKPASVAFIQSVEILENGTQVWQTEVSNADATLPIYVQVSQDESGLWLLDRVLFEQETTKYQTQSELKP